jgi:hypothetical protein
LQHICAATDEGFHSMKSEPRAVFSLTTVELVDRFLRGELVAVATYDRAVEHIDDQRTRATLERCRRSHAERAAMLAEQIEAHGGCPPRTAGVWGVLTIALEMGAAAFGTSALLKLLLEGERTGLRHYETDTLALVEPHRNAVQHVLLRKQLLTMKRIEALARSDSD